MLANRTFVKHIKIWLKKLNTYFKGQDKWLLFLLFKKIFFAKQWVHIEPFSFASHIWSIHHINKFWKRCKKIWVLQLCMFLAGFLSSLDFITWCQWVQWHAASSERCCFFRKHCTDMEGQRESVLEKWFYYRIPEHWQNKQDVVFLWAFIMLCAKKMLKKMLLMQDTGYISSNIFMVQICECLFPASGFISLALISEQFLKT